MKVYCSFAKDETEKTYGSERKKQAAIAKTAEEVEGGILEDSGRAYNAGRRLGEGVSLWLNRKK